MGLIEYMSEERLISRFKVLLVGLIGMFCGAVLTTMFLWLAVVS